VPILALFVTVRVLLILVLVLEIFFGSQGRPRLVHDRFSLLSLENVLLPFEVIEWSIFIVVLIKIRFIIFILLMVIIADRVLV
jgi:hypothetical protein